MQIKVENLNVNRHPSSCERFREQKYRKNRVFKKTEYTIVAA